jgi:hypothetical protein
MKKNEPLTWGTKYDEAKERAWLENFFADDLKED